MKIAILTLGCKVNKYESDALAENLTLKGYETTDALEAADVYVINSCAVTAEAEKKSRQMIARCRKFNAEAKIFVCGCASQNNPQQFLDKDVEYVSGVAGKLKISEYIDNFAKNGKKMPKRAKKVAKLPKEYEDELIAKQSRIRAYIKIQDGCNNFCSYCIIPYLRGRSRSREIFSIINEANSLDENIKEIVLTGINVTDYKIDGQPALLTLLEQLDRLGKRIRLGSVEDTVVSEEFIKGLSKLNNFCPHFHLSLQSGCDSVLKRMNRHYSSNQFAHSVALIRKYFPNAGITTDVIVGFCDESEEEFTTTCQFVKRVKFSQLHVFPYSKREGTAAAKLYKDLPKEVKTKRVQMLEKIGDKLKRRFIKQNKTGKVLIEEQQGEYFVGYTENYIRVYIPAEKQNDELINKILTVKLKKLYKDGAIAKIVRKMN
ncbi:MAG: tRNA (N(6)-L-threonylcarbamoyladenosine(37)-C(2))-methylthiotransferase MtaB [Clostridia bacterium]|nr:tRNA (N(6)-L-threonylcarbamoyladenosine(37)-C(2))-methylthiotransferase MtaB [Clostridia bacterium]